MNETKKTRDEIDILKMQWRADPIWDIEDTEGFEFYRNELYVYRIEYENASMKDRLQVWDKRLREIAGVLAPYIKDAIDSNAEMRRLMTGDEPK
jgi:hypothetical protein